MVRVILRGCSGRMGRVISGLLAEDREARLVAGVDLVDDGHNPYPVYRNVRECDVEADCLIDFSSAADWDDMLDYCVEKKLPCVLCTTGLSDAQLEKIEKASESIAVLRSANMSMGINLLLKLLKNAASVLAPAGFDMEVVERHHNQKLDAPSGTALALADSLNEELGNAYTYVYDRSSRREKRPEKEIGISAVRGGSIVGEHEVIFAGVDEVITFSHTAYSRAVFGKGAVQAAKYLAGNPAGKYDMGNVVDSVL